MKAIGYSKSGSIEETDALVEFEAQLPELGPYDLLVAVKAVSVNPVDTKVRANISPEGDKKIIGYDASGIVHRAGDAVGNFKAGDAVFYAGDITRPGTNAEFHAVDSRIVGRKPESFDFAAAAGLPLTSITAWELLFDSLGVREGRGQGDTILIIGGAGGVGSILIQLAKRLTSLTVIATASRPETADWVKKMGADYVIDHRKSLVGQVKELALVPRYVAALTGTKEHLPAIIALIRPRGHIAFIDDPGCLDIMPGKTKALSFSWEYMFCRPMHKTEDMHKQGELLNRVSALIDQGLLASTVRNNLGKINAKNLKRAHALQEGGAVIGKNVLAGF